MFAQIPAYYIFLH